MAPAAKPKSQTSANVSKKAKSRAITVKLDGSGSVSKQLKRIDPLTAFSRHLTPLPSTPPLAKPHLTRSSTIHGGKGKAKETNIASPVTDAVDFSLWVDRYEPTTEEELAVHLKKVESIRQWLKEAFEGGASGTLKKYRRILLLTGRAGTGKTSTIRVLGRELGFEILEWKSSAGTTTQQSFSADILSFEPDQNALTPEFNNTSLFARFEAFLTRASTCSNIFSSTSNSSIPVNRRIILLEDLPNVLHQETQSRFHQALHSLVNSPPSEPHVPVVIILSDAGMRGEERDEKLMEGRGGAGWDKNQVVDKRTVIPRTLLGGVYVTEIGFNPISATLLRKALQSLLNKHFSQPGGVALSPSKEVLDVIVESANGDIRSAIMALQFACVVELPGSRKKGKTVASKIVLEAVTRREQSLVLFHLLGKVLYNKRRGDPPNPSATAKDLQREREIDASLKDPMKLPSHLEHHERRSSRVDVNSIYSDSPIDSSLFSLYIHQNYVQFCEDLEHCDSISEWLSWIDSSGGEAWYQANPHQFHLLALGTLHSLPSPVPRRSQKYFKPEFFSFLQKEKDAWDAVQMTREWIVESGVVAGSSGTCRAGGWSKNDVVLELGAVLKAKDASPSIAGPPKQHSLFSKLELANWKHSNAGSVQQLDELDDEAGAGGDLKEQEVRCVEPWASADAHHFREEQKGGWLENDDIEDFE